jgi:hypothetical protein
MFDQEEKFWSNQQLIYFNDNIYKTNSSLDLSISNSTKDFRNFSNSIINLSITSTTDRRRRFQILNNVDIMDLLNSTKYIIDNEEKIYDENKHDIVKRYNHDKDLIFRFRKASSTGEKCVVIMILHNESDFGKIIVSYDIFKLIIQVLREFQNKFIEISIGLQTRFLLSEILNSQKLNEISLKSIPGAISAIQIQSNNYTENSNLQIEQKDEILNEEYEDQLKELDSFIENADIQIPEISKIESEINKPITTQIITSNLIDKVLKNNISNFEDIINSTYLSLSPITEIIDIFRQAINPDSSFDFLPGITENDKKSSLYFSKTLFTTIFYSHINGGSIPPSVPTIKYRVDFNKVQDLNNELAYDLLIILLYLKIFRNKVSDKEESSSLNKSIVYIGARCFTDILAFSFLENMNVKSLSSMVAARLKYFNDHGFFDSYNQILERCSCNKITENEMLSAVDEVITKIIGTSEFIDEIHKFFYTKGQLILPYDNDLTMEQITGDFIRFESGMKSGEIDIKTIDVDEKIKSYLLVNIPKESSIISKKSDNVLFRYMKTVIEEIPINFRDNFMNYIISIEGDYNFENHDFPIEELGEKILKGLYEWNESNKKDSLSNFCFKVEESIMNKDLIIAKIKNSKDENIDKEIQSESNDAWDMVL